MHFFDDSARSETTPGAHTPRPDRGPWIAAASRWLERVLDADVPLPEARSARDRSSRRATRLIVARALARTVGESEGVARVRATIVRDQRADGGFDGAHAAVAADASSTAACIEILIAHPNRSGSEEDALARAIRCASNSEVSPAAVRAQSLVSTREGMQEILRRATRELESEFETHALQPLANALEAADRLHAWHSAAAALALDMRRHPAVQQCTLALIQRVEASAGEVYASYAKDGRITGSPADSATATRAALALFAVADVIVGPRAAFAADLTVDALVARAHDGVLRATRSRFSQRSVIATALLVEALHRSQMSARAPWSLPTANAAGTVDVVRVDRRA